MYYLTSRRKLKFLEYYVRKKVGGMGWPNVDVVNMVGGGGKMLT